MVLSIPPLMHLITYIMQGLQSLWIYFGCDWICGRWNLCAAPSAAAKRSNISNTLESGSAEFHGARIEESAHQVHHLNDYDRLSPYVPVNKLIYNVHYKDDNGYETDAVKESFMNAIRSGQLLLYNESESCSPCWAENQVEFHKPERATVSEKFPSLQCS
ncbi:hypothetical protein Btru_047128 [Bulinus truncatus]|nr:hypothetical protein Btru_047128 [Bulinus truncatus]